VFLSSSPPSDGVSGGTPRDSGLPTPTDEGADEAVDILVRDDLTGEDRGVVVVFNSVSCSELSLTCKGQKIALSPQFASNNNNNNNNILNLSFNVYCLVSIALSSRARKNYNNHPLVICAVFRNTYHSPDNVTIRY